MRNIGWTLAVLVGLCGAIAACSSGGDGADTGTLPVADSGGTPGADTGGGPPATPGTLAKRYMTICGWEAVCGGDGANSFEWCLDALGSDELFDFIALQDPDFITARLACLSNITDCAGVDPCMMGSLPTCTEEGLSCRDDALVWCGGGREMVRDCGSWGAVCRLEDGDGTCAYDSAPLERCTGSVATRHEERGSDGDIFWVVWCNALGMSCVDGNCVDPGQVMCTEARCEGTKMVQCRNGMEMTFDCAEGGSSSTCWDDDGQLRCGRAPADALCQGESCRCDGSVAECCRWGVPVRWDCADFGATCQEDGGGVGCVRL